MPKSPAGGLLAQRTPVQRPRTGGVVDTLVAANGGLVQHIPLSLIDPHPDNPREDLGDLTGLVSSIRSEVGLMQPLTVASSRAFWAARGVTDTIDDGRYVILAGHRRRAALEQAGHSAAPCLVRDDLAGDQAVVAMLIENLHRDDLEPLEEARGFARLRELGLTQTQIADKVGCTQGNVSKKLALLKLPTAVQERVAEHRLSVADAVELAEYADDPELIEAAVNDRQRWESFEETAQRIREDRDEQQRLEAARDELRAQGLKRFVTSRPVNYRLEDYLRYGRGPMSIDALKRSDVDVTDHDALPCHAVSVTTDYHGNVITEPVCTKPKNHAGDLQAKRDRAEVRKQREAEKNALQAGKRRELVRALLAAKPSKELSSLVDALVIDHISRGSNEEDSAAALATVLGMDPPSYEHGRETSGFFDRIDAMAASDNAATRQRLIAALILIDCELDVDRSWGDHRRSGAYLRFLQSQGHTFAGNERRHLGRNA